MTIRAQPLAVAMGRLKMRDMKMRHKMQRWKMREKVCMESHKSIDVAEYIVCSFMHKIRHILTINA